MSLLKAVIIALFIFVFFSLFQALRIMQKGNSEQPMSQFLGRRLLVSIVIFLLILIAIGLGLITPNQRPY